MENQKIATTEPVETKLLSTESNFNLTRCDACNDFSVMSPWQVVNVRWTLDVCRYGHTDMLRLTLQSQDLGEMDCWVLKEDQTRGSPIFYVFTESACIAMISQDGILRLQCANS